MSEEKQTKPEAQEEKKSGAGAKMVLKMLLGVVLLGLGVLLIILWWPSVWTVIKGCVGGVLVLAGLIAFAIAKE